MYTKNSDINTGVPFRSLFMGMEKYEAWKARHQDDNPPREKIVKLGRKITDVAGHIFGGVKVEDPEYWGLAEIISDEMADVARESIILFLNYVS